MEPIWSLLNSKSKAAEWTAQHRGSLGSAVAGRQYPQTRVMRNGWAAHNKCIFCLHDIVEKEKGKCCGGKAPSNAGQTFALTAPSNAGQTFALTAVTRGVRDPVIATAEQIAKAPVGSLVHRNWSCPKHDGLRKEYTSEADRRTVVDANVQGHPAWERALVARPPPPRKKKAAVESFKWHVQPQALQIRGTFYTDGSARGGPIKELVRCGWSFVAVNSQGEVIAAAYGVPPPWVEDIGGAEV